MKTLYAIVLLAFVGLAILNSALKTTDQLVAPVEKASTISLDKQVLHSITGSANAYNILYDHPDNRFLIIPGPKQKDGFYNVFTVNAIEHGDGTVTGNLISTVSK